MGSTVTINVRMDAATKSKVVRILDLLGMTPSEAINAFFKQIIYTRGIPFELKAPNKLTLEAIEELDSGKGVRFDSADELLKDLKS